MSASCTGNPLLSDEERVDCGNDATWQICCSDPSCRVDFKVCDWHEIVARAKVIVWVDEGGYCPFCGMKYTTREHATQRWYRFSDAPPFQGQRATV